MSEAAALLEVILETNADHALAGLERFSHGFDSLANKVKQGIAFSIGFAAAEAGLHGITDAFHAVGEAAIGLNSQLQQTEFGFKTLLGSAEAAKAMMVDLADFALRTPFELQNLSKGAAQLLALGFEGKQLIPILTAVGNAAAALGIGQLGVDRINLALSQMYAAERVRTQEMNQLTEARVPAWQILSQAIGKTTGDTRKMVEDGLIPAITFLTAFEQRARSTAAGGWGNAMADQANTFKVAFDNAREAVGLFIASGFKPLFDLVTEGVVKFRDLTQTERWARWGEALTKFVGEGVAALRALLTFLKPVGDAIGRVFDNFADLMGIPQRAEKAAGDAGKDVGLAFADGVGQGLAGKDPFKAITEGFDKAIAAARVPLTKSQTALDDIRAAGEAAIKADQDQIDKIDALGNATERITNIDRDRSILQLNIAEAAIKEKEARERILDAAKDTISTSGRIRLGVDPEKTKQQLDALDLGVTRAGLEANRQFEKLAKDEKKAPFEASIARTKQWLQDTIGPIQEMNRQTENQIKNLEVEGRQWREIAQTAKDAATSASGTSAKPSAFPDVSEPADRRDPFKFDPEAFKARLGAMKDAIFTWIGEQRTAVWDKITNDWGPGLWLWIQTNTPIIIANLRNLKDRLFQWIGDRKDELTEKWKQDWGPAVSAWLPGAFESVKTWLKDNAGEIIGAGLLGAIGLMTFGPMGAIIGAGLGAAIGQGLWDNNEFWAKIYDIQHAMTRGLTPDGIKAYEDFKTGMFSHFDPQDWFDKGDEIGQNIGKGIIKAAPGIAKGLVEAVDWASTGIQAGLAFGEGVVVGVLRSLADLNLKLWDTIFDAIGQAARRALGQTPEGLPRTPYTGGPQYTAPIGPLPAGAPTIDLPSSSINLFPYYPPPPPAIVIPPAAQIAPPIRQPDDGAGLTRQGFGYIPTGPLLPTPSLTTTAPTINVTISPVITVSGDVSDVQVQKIENELEQKIPPMVYRQLLDAIHASGW